MRKRTPRQHLDPMACFTRRMPLRDEQKIDLGIAYRMQLQAMLRGAGSEEAWSTLACSLNIAMVLCEQGIAPTYLHPIQLAQDALLACRERAGRVGRWAFSGDEARLIMRACAVHDEQLELATRAQVTKALNEVNDRILNGEVLA